MYVVLLQNLSMYEKLGVSGIICIVLSTGLVTLWIVWAKERKARITELNKHKTEMLAAAQKYEEMMEKKNKEIRSIELEAVKTTDKVTTILYKTYEHIIKLRAAS